MNCGIFAFNIAITRNQILGENEFERESKTTTAVHTVKFHVPKLLRFYPVWPTSGTFVLTGPYQ
jgi:hypothetical protein